jgi:aryl-alcohol dehydrogenase-like predicted oxidoreductase
LSSSRRNFLAAGLALPAAVSASPTGPQTKIAMQAKAPSTGPVFTYRNLGKTGLKVTSVGFGCMVTSDGSVIERAADMGITHFDTARVYSQGNNERMVGAALKGKRKNLVLSSKTPAKTKADAMRDLDKSLSELGTDWLDIWYLHARNSPAQITEELIEAQQEAKKAGKIRFAGVSTHQGHAELIPWLAKHPKVDVILTSYNFTMDASMAKLVADSHAAGKGIVAMKIMAGGFRRIKPGDPLGEKLKREGAMLAALKWALKDKNVDTTIPSITDTDQLEENIKAMASGFSGADEKLLAEQLRYIRPLYCRSCGQCAGQCKQGLPVADIIRILSYADGYGEFGLARERYLELPEQHAQAKCSSCSGCTIDCPNGVRVAERVSRAQELLA